MPETIELPDGKAVFTIRVTYDTQALYGEVTGLRTIIVARDK